MKELICAFDVNETLLDLKVLDPWFDLYFGKKEFRQIWFKNILHTSLVLNATDRYQEFKIIGATTLESLAKQFNIDLSDPMKTEFQNIMATLPPHPDVEISLHQLKKSGYRLFALSNSSQQSVTELLNRAGLLSHFEECLSTDSVKKFKPDLAPYKYLAEKAQSEPNNIWLVAAHAWDTTGAQKAGLKSALVLREGHGYNKLFSVPTVQGLDLPAVAQFIIQKDKLII